MNDYPEQKICFPSISMAFAYSCCSDFHTDEYVLRSRNVIAVFWKVGKKKKCSELMSAVCLSGIYGCSAGSQVWCLTLLGPHYPCKLCPCLPVYTKDHQPRISLCENWGSAFSSEGRKLPVVISKPRVLWLASYGTPHLMGGKN